MVECYDYIDTLEEMNKNAAFYVYVVNILISIDIIKYKYYY